MDLDLRRRTFIVTGGTDGLGRSLVSRLLMEGAHVTACGRDRTRLTETSRALSSAGALLTIQADVTDPDDLRGLVQETVAAWGRLDGIVNNAGRSASAPFEASNDTAWQSDLDLKVLAPVRLIRLALPYLREARAAAVVNVLNIGAKSPNANSLPTSASRAAGLAITKSLSKEFGPDGIRINAIMVGTVRSSQWSRRAERESRPVDDLYSSLAATIPLGRVGHPEEFADLAAFLLSNRASFITGTAINLDGGQCAAP